MRHRFELKALLEEAVTAKSTDEWWRLFNAAGVPAGPVYSVSKALEHPQIAERGMISSFADVPGVGRDIRLVRTGFKVNGEAPRVATPPPQLGQRSDKILAELGYEADIKTLRTQKAV